MAGRSDPLQSVLYLAIGAGVVYLAWKYVLPAVQGIGTAASTATNATSSAIANAINWATGVSAPSVPASTAGRGVNMPDGSVVPLSSFTGVQASADSTYLLGVYQGTMYAINGPLDANGNYTAS